MESELCSLAGTISYPPRSSGVLGIGKGFYKPWSLTLKDSQRFLTDSQKAECLAAAGYKCEGQYCTDRDLSDKPYDFHHVKLHSEFGLTTRYNTQVLCLPCHRLAHEKRNIETFTDSGWSGLRSWQRDAINRFIELESEKTFVLEAAPGSGKSRFAAFISQYAITEMGIDHVVFIAPWLPILTSVKTNFGPIGLQVRDKFHYDKKRGVLQVRPSVDVTLDTYSGFCNQTTIDVIEDWQRRRGFSFMLILDELHHTNVVSGKWGPCIERIAALSEKLVVMSGTYFRSDSRPISFLQYQNDKPVTDYSINFAKCVESRFTRQVSFRFHDPVLEFHRSRDKARVRKHLSKIPQSSQKMLNIAKKTVLDTSQSHVDRMIVEAWNELSAMRNKWPDAACLVVCKPSSTGKEEREIHAVESRIKHITGTCPQVVTSDDSMSRGKIDNFCKTSDPFLCAIRMVSEGVDIPRIRMVLFLSYTDSEMLFRQIVGRCCRYIDGKEDDTAALVIMPKFKVMADFADRFEQESKVGSLNLLPVPPPAPPRDESEESKCRGCGKSPCVCYVLLDSESKDGGGFIASRSVDELYIRKAKIIRDRCAAHQHANVVQLGNALQESEKLGDVSIVANVEDMRSLACNSIRVRVETLARFVYGGSFAEAWRKEVHEVTGATLDEMRSTWRVEQLNEFHESLKTRISEAVDNA